MSKKEDEGFVERWSRRKRGGANAADAHSTKVDVNVEKPVDVADLSALPSVKELLPTSDFTAFLRDGVPDELRRLALRKAWSLDPAIRDFVEVAENQYDWNAPDGVPGFGPLDSSVDLQALLAQATGEIQALENSPNYTNLHQESQKSDAPCVDGDGASPQSTAAPQHPCLDAAPDCSTQRSVDAIPATTTTVAALPKYERRRHGGALPDRSPTHRARNG